MEENKKCEVVFIGTGLTKTEKTMLCVGVLKINDKFHGCDTLQQWTQNRNLFDKLKDIKPLTVFDAQLGWKEIFDGRAVRTILHLINKETGEDLLN